VRRYVLNASPELLTPPDTHTTTLANYVGRYGTRPFASAGLACCAVGLLLCRLVSTDETGHKVLLVVLLVDIGAGFALVLTAVMADFANSRASASDFGVYNISAMLPMTVSSLALGDYEHRGGWAFVTTFLGGVCGMSAVACVLFILPRPSTCLEKDSPCSSKRLRASGDGATKSGLESEVTISQPGSVVPEELLPTSPVSSRRLESDGATSTFRGDCERQTTVPVGTQGNSR
jgi:Trk-type K+ transport system membrane component